MFMRLTVVFCLLCIPDLSWGLGWFGNDLYGTPCHGSIQGFGPYDYNDPELQKRRVSSPLWLVEKGHFSQHVQMLKKGLDENHASNAANLDYVLRAFPNHYKALWVMIRYYLSEGRPRYAQSGYPPAECYLQRAIKFRPKDAALYMLYGNYLQLAGMPDKAVKFYKKALSLDPKSAEAHYNYGLVLLKQKKYEDAKKQAKQAYELGYPLPGLKTRLQEAGYPLDTRDKK